MPTTTPRRPSVPMRSRRCCCGCSRWGECTTRNSGVTSFTTTWPRQCISSPPRFRLGLMQTTLGQFNETQSQDAFALQNSKLLKVRLGQVTIQAKLGSMVAYQGDVTFEHAGSGGLGRMLKKAMTGEGTQLMKVTGTGEVFLADQ